MLKSKIRKKILKIKKKKNNGKVVINFYKIYNLLKDITQINKKIIGGYYPINHEIDDLKMLKEFEKKKN